VDQLVNNYHDGAQTLAIAAGLSGLKVNTLYQVGSAIHYGVMAFSTHAIAKYRLTTHRITIAFPDVCAEPSCVAPIRSQDLTLNTAANGLSIA
jgi:hypothetical protein